MGRQRIVVAASRHSYDNTPIRVSQEDIAILESGVTALRELSTGREIAVQKVLHDDRHFLYWIPGNLQKGKSVECEVVLDSSPASTAVELVDSGGDKVEFHIGGKTFVGYCYGGDVARPFLYPVIGPGGKNVTRHYPMLRNVRGETKDHQHHRSVWVAHGDVNGADNWSEDPGHARIVHRRFLEKSQGPVLARVRALNDWVDNQGKKLLEEVRTITVYNLPDAHRLIDLDVVFRATEGDVKFGDTKEGGIVSVRVATSMDGNKSGVITNSYGGVTEAETWGKRAHWCDYSGPVEGRILGIAIFDNPKNFRYPTYWHVRDYGLMTANPFALSAYHDPSWDGSYVLEMGDTFSFSYRIYVHDGDVKGGNVAEQYHAYINPPAVTVK